MSRYLVLVVLGVATYAYAVKCENGCMERSKWCELGNDGNCNQAKCWKFTETKPPYNAIDQCVQEPFTGSVWVDDPVANATCEYEDGTTQVFRWKYAECSNLCTNRGNTQDIAKAEVYGNRDESYVQVYSSKCTTLSSHDDPLD